MRPRHRALVIASIAIVGFAAWLARSLDAPASAVEPPAISAANESAVVHADRPMPSPTSSSATLPTMPAHAGSAGHVAKESIDTCDPIGAAETPSEFPTVSADGVTVAWDPTVKLESTALAYVTMGMLAEAAQLTGTVPRSGLDVVVYASHSDFVAHTGAPEWAGGLYDGAIELFADRYDKFGVSIEALRHEAMHAQLHAAIGCTPVWLNEGLAQYFAKTAPHDAWLDMLHRNQPVALASLQTGSVEDVGTDQDAVYAQSLAMVLYTLDHGTDLKELLRSLRIATERRGARAALELWGQRFPDVTGKDLLDSIARRMFAMPTGPELDKIFEGAVCCHGYGMEETCTGGERRAERKWIDERHMWCRAF